MIHTFSNTFPFLYLPIRWFCHLDDDNYLNPNQLVLRLQEYNPEEQDIYIGECRLGKPIETFDKERPGVCVEMGHIMMKLVLNYVKSLNSFDI